ncbi:MAG: nuclear transport factor 2 family protein [Chitinophagaceae bacterium]
MKSATKILTLILVNFLLVAFTLPSCKEKEQTEAGVDTKAEEKVIIATLDSFNRAAARADFDRYFGFYTDDAIFAGTDATERWDLPAFKVWSKPYFDRGRAWDFTAIERHIYFDKSGSLAWFDELLNTQMKICRGSGVLIKKGNDWKVAQYILSATVPNPILDSVITLKAATEDSLINTLQKK